MYEHSASFSGGLPNDVHFALYAAWSKGDWGMIITGNVQVDSKHLTLGRDIILPEALTPDALHSFKQLSAAIHGRPQSEHELHSPKHMRPLAIMQLSHAGRQSPLVLGGRLPFAAPLAPSAVPIGRKQHAGVLSEVLYRVMFQTPRKMEESDINGVVNNFVRGARLACESGFDGVELHASHGCKRWCSHCEENGQLIFTLGQTCLHSSFHRRCCLAT